MDQSVKTQFLTTRILPANAVQSAPSGYGHASRTEFSQVESTKTRLYIANRDQFLSYVIAVYVTSITILQSSRDETTEVQDLPL
jgi:hypothetical protein